MRSWAGGRGGFAAAPDEAQGIKAEAGAGEGSEGFVAAGAQGGEFGGGYLGVAGGEVGEAFKFRVERVPGEEVGGIRGGFGSGAGELAGGGKHFWEKVVAEDRLVHQTAGVAGHQDGAGRRGVRRRAMVVDEDVFWLDIAMN